MIDRLTKASCIVPQAQISLFKTLRMSLLIQKFLLQMFHFIRQIVVSLAVVWKKRLLIFSRWHLVGVQRSMFNMFNLNDKRKIIMLTISASHEREIEGTVLKLPESEVRYWVGLAAMDIRLASWKLEFKNRSEEDVYIALWGQWSLRRRVEINIERKLNIILNIDCFDVYKFVKICCSLFILVTASADYPKFPTFVQYTQKNNIHFHID